MLKKIVIDACDNFLTLVKQLKELLANQSLETDKQGNWVNTGQAICGAFIKNCK